MIPPPLSAAARAGLDAHSHGSAIPFDLVVIALAILVVAVYAAGAVASSRRGRPWPLYRTALWAAGIALATIAALGPLAHAAHTDFIAHMWAHLLGGMLAPLLLVLAAPVTLALRTLAVTPARRLTRALRSMPARLLAHPISAAALSAGGLWLIYLTPVFEAMQASPLVHIAVHAHLLFAGYLFIAAVIGLDPAPHRPNRVVTAVVLVLAMASHSILAKYLYANPPGTVPTAQAQDGAQLMYYAGAWIEAAIIVIFCAQWYRAAGRRAARPQLAPAVTRP